MQASLLSLRCKPRCDWTQTLYRASPLTMLHVVCLMHHHLLDISTLRHAETLCQLTCRTTGNHFTGRVIPLTKYKTEHRLNRDKMPPPSRSIRRCAFKLPKNNKYQCQKPGDNYQLRLSLWYCRRHDRHAQDRCQVLVEWAGKGVQCEKLGHLDGVTGKRLCDLHKTKEEGDERLQVQRHLPGKPEESAKDDDVQVTVQHKRIRTEDRLDCDNMASTSPPSTPIDRITPLSTPMANALEENSPTDMACTPPAQQRDKTPPSSKAPSTPPSPCHPPLNPALPVPTPLNHASNSPHPPKQTVAIPSQPVPQAAPSPTTITSPETRSHSTRPPRKRADSLIPSSPTPAHPLLTLHAALHSPSSPSSPHRITALYAQCCVCLERHGEHGMRVVAGCGHRYREVCLKKAGKGGGGLRRFLCGGCRVWGEGVREEWEKGG